MSTSASRQFRATRNALAEALGLGEALPLRDLPVSADPSVVPFGGTAAIAIADSERNVTYSLLDQSGKPLPGNGGPQATGTGDVLAITSPAVDEDVSYMIGAACANGRTATLFEVAAIKVGLDASLPVRLASVTAIPPVIDYNAFVTVAVDHSQEGVTYSLVARPVPDTGAPDDIAAMANDIKLAGAFVGGTGDTIMLSSNKLPDDIVVRVRALKNFTGPTPRPPQTVLLAQSLPVFVRPDAGLAVTINPAVVVHAGTAAVTIAKAVKGVSYRLHARLVPDADFSRADPPDPATLAVPTENGDVHIVTPPPTVAWEEPGGFTPLTVASPGAGADLTIAAGSFNHDTLLIVEARKTHGSGTSAFTSAERLAMMAAALVRPDPAPGLKLDAVVVDGKLAELHGLAGEPGVFYAVGAPAALGELYFHQVDPADATRNKGIGSIAVAVDMVTADGSPQNDTRMAPPPLPWLATDTALPATLTLMARRAMTNLTTDFGTIAAAPLPAATVPATVAAGSAATVAIAQPIAGEVYQLLVNGAPVGAPVTGAAAAISLDSGALPAGAMIELRATGDANAAVALTRRTPLAIVVA
jgi:hypothetical protein